MHPLSRSAARRTIAGSLLLLTMLVSAPAWATYVQKVTVTGGNASELPAASIRFESSDGSQVEVRKDDDGGLSLVFPGDKGASGTLVIDFPDGSSTRVAIPEAPAGVAIGVDLPGGTAAALPPSVPLRVPTVEFKLGGGMIQIDPPSVGAGTVIGSGGERFAATTDNRMAMPSISASISFAAGPGALSIYAGAGWGDDAVQTSVANGTDNVGIVYHDFSPNRSTGVFLGARGLDTRIEREVDYLKFGGVYQWAPLNREGALGFGPRTGLGYMEVRQQIRSAVSSPTYGSAITSEAEQRVKDRYMIVSLGVGAATRPPTGLYAGAGADALLVYRRSRFESSQHNICTLCAMPQRDFTITIDEEDDEVSIGGKLSIELGLRTESGFSAALQGYGLYLDKVAAIRNTMTGDDLFVRNQPSYLGSESSFSYGGQLVLGFRF